LNGYAGSGSGWMDKPRYIVVEGPIGVGKTTLAKKLGEEFGARVILERPEDNPFLERFYEDQDKYAFQTQIFFLLSRFRQQQELIQLDLFQQTTVVDYFFEKDIIFASLTLSDEEFALYQQVYKLLNAKVSKPDLVIYLQAGAKVLLERISRRGKPFEKKINPGYIESLNELYNDYFFYYNDSPLLVVNTNDIDFVEKEDDFKELVKEIRQMKKGTQHFIPLGSR
jgi:deoxyguanosine kinase